MAATGPGKAASGETGPVACHRFLAMGSPCEVQVDHGDPALTRQIGAIVEREALRIEAKFSRYRDDSVISSINCSGGAWFQPDTETAALLDLAAQCHAISDGRFDITSGVLREAWVFDGSDRVPDPERVRALMPLVGWSRLDWANGALRLAPGMQIDFGGLAKEYAVDRAIALVAHEHPTPVLVNFGGDLRVSGPRHDGSAWRVLIESVEPGTDRAASAWLELGAGAITTSGDVRRFVQRDGVRYSHILDPRTGWPVRNAPRAVTVAAATCTAAGILSTLAMLHGAKAERFLRKERVKAWVSR